MIVELFGDSLIADCSFTTLLRYRRDFGVSLFDGNAPKYALLYTALHIAEPYGAFVVRVSETELTQLEATLAEALIKRECTKCNAPTAKPKSESEEFGEEEELDIENTVLRWASTAQIIPTALEYCTLGELLDMVNQKSPDTRRMATVDEIRTMFPEV